MASPKTPPNAQVQISPPPPPSPSPLPPTLSSLLPASSLLHFLPSHSPRQTAVAVLCAQIMPVLESVQAAVWFFARQSPGMKRYREEPPLPLGPTLAQFSQCAPVRLTCGCVTTACRRLATVPAGVNVVYRTTGRWAAWIMERVTRGRVRRVVSHTCAASARRNNAHPPRCRCSNKTSSCSNPQQQQQQQQQQHAHATH